MIKTTREAVIVATLHKYRLPSHDEDWARRLIEMPLSEIRNRGGDLVDFTGSGNVLAAAIEAREALAKAELAAR